MGPALRQIPIAVLFGVFFYMGLAGMRGIQLVDRFKLMFMPVKYHPNVPYVRKVRRTTNSTGCSLLTILRHDFRCVL